MKLKLIFFLKFRRNNSKRKRNGYSFDVLKPKRNHIGFCVFALKISGDSKQKYKGDAENKFVFGKTTKLLVV
jgi:hypothetical protein